MELRSPVRIDVLGPPPGSRGKFVQQIGVEKHGAGGAGIAILYLDGVTLDAETSSDADSATIFANFESDLEAGPPHRGGVHERCRRGRGSGLDVRALEAYGKHEDDQREPAGCEDERAHGATVDRRRQEHVSRP